MWYVWRAPCKSPLTSFSLPSSLSARYLSMCGCECVRTRRAQRAWGNAKRFSAAAAQSADQSAHLDRFLVPHRHDRITESTGQARGEERRRGNGRGWRRNFSAVGGGPAFSTLYRTRTASDQSENGPAYLSRAPAQCFFSLRASPPPLRPREAGRADRARFPFAIDRSFPL